MKLALVLFKEPAKKYYYNPQSLELKLNDQVVVETLNGLEIGKVAALKEIDESTLTNAVKDIIRLADQKDLDTAKENLKMAPKLHNEAKGIIESHELGMKVVDVELSLDRRKLTIFFEADGRIDFRDLVKDLAEEMPYRIELRQVGQRDTAKIVGGIGPCGLILCCATFIGDFDTISIKMAKNQNLSLNPQKISGSCGKLLCCIKYEDDVYTELRVGLPDLNAKVVSPLGNSIVVAVNILARRVRVRNEAGAYEWFGIEEITKNEK